MACCSDCARLGGLGGLADDAMRAGRERLTELGRDAMGVAHQWRAVRDRWRVLSQRAGLAWAVRKALEVKAAHAEGRRTDAVKVYDWTAAARDLLGGQAGTVDGLGALPVAALVLGGVAVPSIAYVAGKLVDWRREAAGHEAQQANMQVLSERCSSLTGAAQERCAAALVEVAKSPPPPADDSPMGALKWGVLLVVAAAVAKAAGVF